MNPLCTLLFRELSLNKTQDAVTVVVFFIIASALIPFGIGSTPEQLSSIAPAIIWVCALLSSLLGIHSIFADDDRDGCLEQLMLGRLLPQTLMIIKILAHFISYGVPLILVAPLLGIMLHLPTPTILPLMLTLCIGIPILSMFGTLGAALTLGLNQHGALAGVILLPLYIPILIFAATIQPNASFASNLALLGGLALFSLPLCVTASSYLLKNTRSE